MKRMTLPVKEIFDLRDALLFQLNYNAAHEAGKVYLKDVRNSKFQHMLDRNLIILDKKVTILDKKLKLDVLLKKYQDKYQKAAKEIEEKIDAGKHKGNIILLDKKKMDAEKVISKEFAEEKNKILENAKPFAIEFYEFIHELPDLDRSGFKLVQHFIKEVK